MKFLLDENLPRSTAFVLRELGHDVYDVREILRGKRDEEIFNYAVSNDMTIITADRDFGNILRFPKIHKGIIIVRLPNELSTQVMNKEISKAIVELKDENIDRSIIVIEVGRIRVKKDPN